MKSIKNFEDKKIENMATIAGGRIYRSFNGNLDRYSKRTGLHYTNWGLFNGKRD